METKRLKANTTENVNIETSNVSKNLNNHPK